MHIDLIKQLLQKHFGAPKQSLTIGGPCVRGESEYYYYLENEAEITALTDLLNSKDRAPELKTVPELYQSLESKDNDNTERFQCVQFIENSEGWTAVFSKVVGVKYRKSYRGKVVATLQLSAYPFVVLSDQFSDFYGFWRRLRSRKRIAPDGSDGFSYWMNKTLYTNERFRAFAVDFFLTFAEADRRYILKDVGRAIAGGKCFLLPISYASLIECRTPAEVIHRIPAVKTDFHADYNKVDLNAGYIMQLLAPEIDEKDWKLLLKLDAKTVAETVSLKMFYDGVSAKTFVAAYYAVKFDDTGCFREMQHFVEDHLEMYEELGIKIKLRLTFDRFMREHDTLAARLRSAASAKELKLPLLKVPSRFDDFEAAIQKHGTKELERICTTERLMREGEDQHNCVFSRRGLVRQDRVSIYHWQHNGKSYTIQFSMDTDGRIRVDEVRARFNQSITTEDLVFLNQMLLEICSGNVGMEKLPPEQGERYAIDNQIFIPDDLF